MLKAEKTKLQTSTVTPRCVEVKGIDILLRKGEGPSWS
jgi:hypothetical protein